MAYIAVTYMGLNFTAHLLGISESLKQEGSVWRKHCEERSESLIGAMLAYVETWSALNDIIRSNQCGLKKAEKLGRA